MSETELAIKLQDVDDRSRSNTHRIDKLEKRQDNLEQLTTAVAGLQKDIEYTNGDVKEIKADVKSLMDVPKSRWNKVVECIITAVVSAIAGAILAIVLTH